MCVCVKIFHEEYKQQSCLYWLVYNEVVEKFSFSLSPIEFLDEEKRGRDEAKKRKRKRRRRKDEHVYVFDILL